MPKNHRKLTEEWKQNISISLKGKHPSKESKSKQSETRKRMFKEGKLFLNEKQLKGLKKGRMRIFNPKQFKKGHIPYNKTVPKELTSMFGKKQSEKWRKSIHKALWKGGISFEPYGLQFNKQLKEDIRIRDNFRCQLCGMEQNGHKLDIHHIDYDKKNCSPENLISLDRKCHFKTNWNRDWWMLYFTNKEELKCRSL